MNFPGTSTKLIIYKTLQVALCGVALMIWIETIEILAVFLLAFLPGMFNEQLKAQFDEHQEKWYISGRFLAPYKCSFSFGMAFDHNEARAL